MIATIRDLLAYYRTQGRLREISAPRSPRLQAAEDIAAAAPDPVLLTDVNGWQVAANLLENRDSYAMCLGLERGGFFSGIGRLLARPPQLERIAAAPCQQVSAGPEALSRLPVLVHYPTDGGPFVTAGVWIINDPEYGRNLSYHRLMITGPSAGTARIVEGRGTDHALRSQQGRLPAAIAIAPPPHVLLAAALSPAADVDELELAARLAPVRLCRAQTVDLDVPADSEIIIEGEFTGEWDAEGPFVDITGTIDGQRRQPVFRVTNVTHRRDPIYHALLPAGGEHRALMGLPKEMDIMRAVSAICPCHDVRITPGGASWLHAVIANSPQAPQQARAALAAAFAAHRSLKLCIAVDEDIDPGDAQQVEWALATRFQAHRDMLVLTGQPSSSLDPSAEHVPGQKSRGSKLGLDATIKAEGAARELFRRISR